MTELPIRMQRQLNLISVKFSSVCIIMKLHACAMPMNTRFMVNNYGFGRALRRPAHAQ